MPTSSLALPLEELNSSPLACGLSELLLTNRKKVEPPCALHQRPCGSLLASLDHLLWDKLAATWGGAQAARQQPAPPCQACEEPRGGRSSAPSCSDDAGLADSLTASRDTPSQAHPAEPSPTPGPQKAAEIINVCCLKLESFVTRRQVPNTGNPRALSTGPSQSDQMGANHQDT